MLNKKFVSESSEENIFLYSTTPKLYTYSYNTVLSHIRSIDDLENIHGDNFTRAVSEYLLYNIDHGIDDLVSVYQLSAVEHEQEILAYRMRKDTDTVFDTLAKKIWVAFSENPHAPVILPAYDVFRLADRLLSTEG